MVGQTLGHFRIEARLGAGGMGVVYRARDTRLERDVALKLLPDQSPTSDEDNRRLLREARAASALNHPNVATIYDVGELAGHAYIAMEYVEGEPLSGRLPPEGLPIDMAIGYGTQIAAALAHAHDRGVIHRDLKSANIVITHEGLAKVLDFGLARRLVATEFADATRATATLDGAGSIAGTVPYMSPEVLRGEGADSRSDIWALGVVLYELIAGHVPFEGRTAFELTSAILREPLPPLPARAPSGLRAVIQRCLDKDPARRYQRAGEVRAALDAIQWGAALPTVALATRSRVASRARFAVAATIALLVVLATIWVLPTRDVATLSTGGTPSANVEANEYFEKGILLVTVQYDLARSRQMLERALELDAEFAEARAWYGYTHLLQIDGGYSNDRAWIYRAEEEIRRALDKDPRSARAHMGLAAIHFYRGRMEHVRTEAEQALAIRRDDPDAVIWLATAHIMQADYEAAERLLRPVMERNPLLFAVRWMLGDTLRERGDNTAAIREFEKILEQDPQNLYAVLSLARSQLQDGNLPGARTALDRTRPEDRANFYFRLVRSVILTAEGHHDAAAKELDDEVLKYAQLAPYVTLLPAEHYAVRGDPEPALDWLERAVQNGDERVEWFGRNRLLANVHNHHRFQQILESIAFRRRQRNR